jgi:RPA family protein
MVQVKRETAIICTVQDLLLGEFVKTEGWSPSYFATDVGDISRANLLGVIVSKEENGLIMDDGSGQILLRSFEANSFHLFEVGDFVLVVGRPRMYNNQKYVMPEILKKIDSAWAEFRKAQLELGRKPITRHVKETKASVEEDSVEEKPINHFQTILEFIKDLDSGDGASSEEVIKRSSAKNVKNADELIRKLIEEGEIFEIRPGRLKLLE